MKNPALKYILKNKNAGDIVHTSAHAKVQTGSSFGAASHEAFSARREIEENRKHIQGYHNSKIINAALPTRSAPKVRTAEQPEIQKKDEGAYHIDGRERLQARREQAAQAKPAANNPMKPNFRPDFKS